MRALPCLLLPSCSPPYFSKDNVYHSHHVGRIWCEMVRPSVGGNNWGGYEWESLRIAGLARNVQSKFYLHSCTTRYCLLNRSCCRFFYPWPVQPQQQHDENTDRVALQRRLAQDVAFCVAHEPRTFLNEVCDSCVYACQQT